MTNSSLLGISGVQVRPVHVLRGLGGGSREMRLPGPRCGAVSAAGLLQAAFQVSKDLCFLCYGTYIHFLSGSKQ